ncbi:MAG: zinc ribbon domain-containing protein [Methanobacteriaceae archaeon]|nr:zinc ribbon domain-containing protein [Methanobacteriaceae archaeon]
MEGSPLICSSCNAEIQKGSKFCKECGKPVEEGLKVNNIPEGRVNCPQCGAELKAENKFCTYCGTKIEPITNCPKCNATLKPGTRFCTECGTNIYEYKPSSTPSGTKIYTGTKITNTPPTTQTTRKDDPMEELKETGMGLMKDVEKTGKGLMKDLGSFLDKSSNKSSKNTIKPAKKNRNFLVCDKCGGYYELQNGESPEDFSDECECGGHLEHKTELP